MNAVFKPTVSDGAIECIIPTTESQREVWLGATLSTEASMAYNESVLLRLRGALDEEALARAMDRLLERHQALRATISPDGTCMLVSHPGANVLTRQDLSGLEPWPGYAAHSVSKAGVVMLTRVLALALAPDVTVNAIAPGAVLVPDDYDAAERDRLARTTPLRRLGSPEDAVAALLYLLEGGDYVTGEVLSVDGGRRLR